MTGPLASTSIPLFIVLVILPLLLIPISVIVPVALGLRVNRQISELGVSYPVVYAGTQPWRYHSGKRCVLAANQREIAFFSFPLFTNPQKVAIPRHEAVLRPLDDNGIVLSRRDATDHGYWLRVRTGVGRWHDGFLRGDQIAHAIARLLNGR